MSTWLFFLVTFWLIFACTHAYYILGCREPPGGETSLGLNVGSSSWYESWIRLYRGAILGDFELFEMEGTDTVYKNVDGDMSPEDPETTRNFVGVHLLFYWASLVINITLMQLLVGILASNYDVFEDTSHAMFMSERARVISRMSERPWIHYFGWPKRWQDQRLVYVRSEDSSGSSEPREMRSMSMRTVVKREMAAMGKKTEGSVQDVAEVVRRMARLEDMVTNLSAITTSIAATSTSPAPPCVCHGRTLASPQQAPSVENKNASTSALRKLGRGQWAGGAASLQPNDGNELPLIE